jgi:hypothetical protein
MYFPWMFVFLALGLIARGGIEIVAAPTAWFTQGLDAPGIMEAQVCAVSALD